MLQRLTHWDLLKSITIDSGNAPSVTRPVNIKTGFTENDKILRLLEIKRQALIAWQNDISCKTKRKAHAKAKAVIESRVRQLKNEWWTRNALEIQQLADCVDPRRFFDATRAVYGPSQCCLALLHSKDGLVLLKDNEQIAARWKEHYEELMNRDTKPEMEALEQLPQQPIKEDTGAPPSLKKRVQDTISNMKNNKAARPDGIPAEILKAGGPDLLSHIHALLLRVWEKEEIPAKLSPNSLSLYI